MKTVHTRAIWSFEAQVKAESRARTLVALASEKPKDWCWTSVRSIADRAGPLFASTKADRRQHFVVERSSSFQVCDRNGNVIEHLTSRNWSKS
jgi:hypothetical protein